VVKQEPEKPAVPGMPAAARDMPDNGCRLITAVERLRQNVYLIFSGKGMVLFGKIQRACGEHHPEMPQEKRVTAEFAVGFFEILNHLQEERMFRFGHQEIVGKPEGFRFRDDGRMRQEKIAIAFTDNIQIGIDSTVFIKDKIPGCINPLNSVGVTPVCIRKPWIPLRNETFQVGVGPEHVLPIRVATLPGRSRLLPFPGNFFSFPCLVNDFGYHQKLDLLFRV